MFYLHRRKACRLVRMIDSARAEIQYLTSSRKTEVNFSDLKASTEPGEPGESRNMKIWEAHVRGR